jgi:diguanylate cyclase (GGDEF)-like protein
MKSLRHSTDFEAAIAPKGPMKRVVVAIFIVILCFCAIFGKVLLDAREAAHKQAVQIAERLAATLSTEIERNIESYNLSLEGLIDNLKYPEVTTVSPEVRQALLFDRSSTAKHLHAITLLDENGIVRLDSRTPFVKPVDRSDRDYFQAHKGNNSSGLYIGAPFLTPNTHQYVIAISRRLSNSDGAFAGVVVGTVRLSYFKEVFKNGSLGLNGNISLLRTDGKLLIRWPYQEAMLGYDLSRSDLFKRFPLVKAGHFETNNLTDGVRRIVVYSQIGDLPLIIGVGQSTNDIYAEWRRYAFSLASLLVLLCIVSGALTIYLIREIKRRNAAETTLAVLATEDGLTALANRRYFETVFDREWRRAMRDQSPIALVMCDADHFKHYNDAYGHQTGDRLLRIIGEVMNNSIRRETDLVARYGGDEFAILLPGSSIDDATRVAGHTQALFAAACTQDGIAGSSLSIGVASVIPRHGEKKSSLVSAADRALYQAKTLGRNRNEIAPTSTYKPTLVASVGQQSAA